MAGLVPAIHDPLRGGRQRRGCPGQARAWPSIQPFNQALTGEL